MPDDPTIWMMNATEVPQDIRVAKSVATILPGELCQCYENASLENDKMSALIVRGFRLAVQAEIDAKLAQRDFRVPDRV